MTREANSLGGWLRNLIAVAGLLGLLVGGLLGAGAVVNGRLSRSEREARERFATRLEMRQALADIAVALVQIRAQVSRIEDGQTRLERLLELRP